MPARINGPAPHKPVRTRIYVSVEGPDGQLVLSGPLVLLTELLMALRLGHLDAGDAAAKLATVVEA